jgi:adhesin transport system outer membrane protein
LGLTEVRIILGGVELRILSFFFVSVAAFGLMGANAFAEEVPVISVSSQSGDLDLRSAIDRAVETHPTITAAKANVQAAGAEVSAANWRRFPSFSVESLLLDQAVNRMQAQAVVDQPLWAGGRISGTIERSQARQQSALASYDEAVLSIASATAQAFFEVHRWRERIQILNRSLAEHGRMVATMERRYAQEVSPLPDLELARSRALQIEQQLFQARAQEGAASSRLRELVGDPMLMVGALPTPPTSWPEYQDDDAMAKVFAFHPTLKRLRYDADGAKADTKLARASILPQLSGQYSYSDAFGHRVGLVLKAQSDGGLSRFASADAAKQKARATELQVAAGERQLRDQVIAVLREYESSRLRLDGSVAASGYAQRVMESYLRQFTSGRRMWLDVMNAVRESTAAEIDATDARISAQSTLVRIMLLTGQWAPPSMKAGE